MFEQNSALEGLKVIVSFWENSPTAYGAKFCGQVTMRDVPSYMDEYTRIIKVTNQAGNWMFLAEKSNNAWVQLEEDLIIEGYIPFRKVVYFVHVIS